MTNLAMGCDGCNGYEEWVILFKRLMKISIAVVRHFIGAVFSLERRVDFLRIVPVPRDMLERWVEVLVCTRSTEEVLIMALQLGSAAI